MVLIFNHLLLDSVYEVAIESQGLTFTCTSKALYGLFLIP